MENMNTLKEKFAREIRRLPLRERREFLDYILSLLKREQIRPSDKSLNDLDPAKDPILSFIGGISHGSLAKDIDEELYGSQE